MIVGVNAYPASEEPEIPVLDIDNDAVRESQVERLEELKRERDCGAVREALAEAGAVREIGRRQSAGVRRGCGAQARHAGRNLAWRLKTSGGVTRRPRAPSPASTPAASASAEEFKKARRMVEEFEREEGRRPRILVAKMGQDGHDRGAKVIATAFADIGFDVDIGPLFQTPREVARFAMDSDVHVVGVSSLAAGHKTLVPQLIAELRALGREDILVVVGGVIPPQDYEFLYRRRRGGNLRAGNGDSDGGAEDSRDAERRVTEVRLEDVGAPERR